MPAPEQFSLTLSRLHGYEFETRFDWPEVPPIKLDEPAPLGGGAGPNASRLVGAAVGNCLSASLLFCLEKGKQRVNRIETAVTGTMMRNPRGRLRIGKLDVRITLEVQADRPERVSRCFELFEDYCVVTASVRRGIPVSVVIVDPNGKELHRQEDEPREPA
jgi:uncharacterized OsmC-like protein